MNDLLKKISKTGVKLLSTVFILSTLTPLAALAADPAYPYPPQESAISYCSKLHPNDPAAMKSCVRDMSTATNGKDQCEDAKAEIKDAEKEALDACRKAGMGTAESCVKKAFICKDQADDDYQDDEQGGGVYAAANTIATITGQTLDTSAMNTGQGCPQWGGKDFADRKDTLDDKLQKLNEDLAKQTEELAKAKDDYAKEIARIKKEQLDAQTELEKQKANLSEQQRQDLAKRQEEQAKMQQQLEQLGMQKMDLENQLNQQQIDQATELLKYSKSAITMECTKQAMDAKTAARTVFKKGGSLGGGAMQSGQSVNQIAAAKAKTCVETFQKARIKIMTTGDAQQRKTRASIESLTNTIANLRVQIQTYADNFKASGDAQTAAQKKAEDDVLKKMQLAVEDMQNLATKLQDDTAAITQKQTAIKTAIANVNKSYSELQAGGKPKSGTEMGAGIASATIGDQVNIIDRILDNQELKKMCPDLSSKYTDPNKRRTSTTSSKGAGGRSRSKDNTVQ